MAFKLGDLVIDRIVNGVAENSKGELLYLLTNLQEATIDITADSVDAVDGTGTIIKTFYRGKQGEFTATNSTISLPVIGAMSGTDTVYATQADPLTIPRIITTAKAENVELPGITDNGASANIVVNAVSQNGTLGDAYPTTAITVSAKGASDNWSKLTIDARQGDTMWIIKYNRSVTENGLKIINRSDAFPKSCKLTLKVLIVDPCETDVVRAAYVVLPNFQPSPEVSIQFSTDATIDFTGRLQTSYCGGEKVLYEVLVCSDDEEEAA